MKAPPYQWIDCADDLEATVRDLSPRVAVDLEADSLFRYQERICLVQISFPDRNVLIDPLALPHLEPLRRLLEKRAVEKVFHGADYDVRLLKQVAGIHPGPLFDTMVAAQLLGFPRVGLSDLLLEKFHIQVEKRFQRANWGQRPLPPEMVRYAVKDTCHLLALRDVMARELEAKGRLAWAREEFQALTKVEPSQRSSPETSRVPGAEGLDDRGRAVLQSLLDWREEEARRRDLPPFKVMRTAVLLEVARERPVSVRDLGRVQGIPRKVPPLWGDAIIGALNRGLRTPPAPLSRRRSHRSDGGRPGANRRFLRLRAIRDRRAEELGLDPGVLCPNASLKALARSRPEDLERGMQETLKGWQLAVIGEALKKALD